MSRMISGGGFFYFSFPCEGLLSWVLCSLTNLSPEAVGQGEGHLLAELPPPVSPQYPLEPLLLLTLPNTERGSSVLRSHFVWQCCSESAHICVSGVMQRDAWKEMGATLQLRPSPQDSVRGF